MVAQVQENSKPKFREKIILVVADLHLCFSLVRLILNKTPYDVFFVLERYQAVDLLALGFKPHLFIFDYKLPGMSRKSWQLSPPFS
jgi:PleD family two-component response regulator